LPKPNWSILTELAKAGAAKPVAIATRVAIASLRAIFLFLSEVGAVVDAISCDVIPF